MKLVIVALALAVVVNSAPISPEQENMLQNIEGAAQSQVSADEAKTAKANEEANKKQLQLKSNQNFAQEMSQKVTSDAEVLKTMKADEEKSIEDAEKIETDAESASADQAQDIERLDQDAEGMSQEVQSDAEKLDKQLRAAEDKMKAVGISDNEEKNLGEASDGGDTEDHSPDSGFDGGNDAPAAEPTGDYQMQLSQTEASAEQEVSKADADEKAAEARSSAVDSQLQTLKNQAKQGLQQLEKSEKRLTVDLNGHTDVQLEQDIENKAHDMEQAVERNAELGESPLQAAERAAEQAANGNDAQPAAEPASYDPQPDPYTNSADPADEQNSYEAPEMPAQDQQAVDNGDVSADLSAIESDAKQLEAYQKSSITEIEKIAQPLQ
jgi:hypothetical protein